MRGVKSVIALDYSIAGSETAAGAAVSHFNGLTAERADASRLHFSLATRQILSSDVRRMIQRDYLIIGSGIGGASACEGIRKYDKRGSVTLAGAEIMHPYKRWILSKSFLREKTAPLKNLNCLEPRWYASHKIETRFGALVTQFNIERRLAVLGNGETIE